MYLFLLTVRKADRIQSKTVFTPCIIDWVCFIENTLRVSLLTSEADSKHVSAEKILGCLGRHATVVMVTDPNGMLVTRCHI